MPKKSSSNVSKIAKEDPVVEQVKTLTSSKEGSEGVSTEEGKPLSTPKNIHDEIDDIFSSKKKKRVVRADENAGGKPKKTKRKKKEKGPGDADVADIVSGRKRKTNDGLTIYSEEELGINRKDAGGTPLCPFDCSCCF